MTAACAAFGTVTVKTSLATVSLNAVTATVFCVWTAAAPGTPVPPIEIAVVACRLVIDCTPAATLDTSVHEGDACVLVFWYSVEFVVSTRRLPLVASPASVPLLPFDGAPATV